MAEQTGGILAGCCGILIQVLCINYTMFNKCCGGCEGAANCCSCCTCGYDNDRPSRRSRNKHQHQQQKASGEGGEIVNDIKNAYTTSKTHQNPPPYSSNSIAASPQAAIVQTVPPLPAQPMLVTDQSLIRENHQDGT